MKKNICIISSSRADYGLLKPFLYELKKSLEVKTQLIVTGSHLSEEFGFTYREIEADGFKINEKIEILLNSDTPVGVSKSMGLTMISFSEAFSRLLPDIVIVMGDRFEIFSAVAAAHVARLPIAHLSGGEVTKGAFDDAFRHSITKMSCLHFTSHTEYSNRVIQLGENPKTVFNVGEIGLNNIRKAPLLKKSDIEKVLGIKFNIKNFLTTFHPVTLDGNKSIIHLKSLLNYFKGKRDINVIFTKTNADTYGRIINSTIENYVKTYPTNSILISSLGRINYLSTLQFVDAVVGNSSSGIIEAPSFKIGTINIGDRQDGRIKAKSVIDCSPTKEGINQAFNKLFSTYFQKTLKNLINPYEKYNGPAIMLKETVNFLKNYILKKGFFDLKYSNYDN